MRFFRFIECFNYGCFLQSYVLFTFYVNFVISQLVHFFIEFYGFILYKNINFTLLTIIQTKFRFILLAVELFKLGRFLPDQMVFIIYYLCLLDLYIIILLYFCKYFSCLNALLLTVFYLLHVFIISLLYSTYL
jgi:hypothetical protein